MTIKIVLAQIFTLDGDRSGNFRRIEHALGHAKVLGADLVCFPEMAILGWVNSAAHHRAFPIPGADTDKLGQLAKDYGVYLAIGIGEKTENGLFDAAILLDDQGQILLKHRKNNILSELMNPPYLPGDGVGVVDTKFGRIGLMICADTFQEDLLQQMKALRPDLLLIPYGWAAPEGRWPAHGLELEKVVTHTAKQTNAVAIGTNLVGQISKGPWAGQVYGGQSLAVDSAGMVLCRGRDRDSDMQMVTVELSPGLSNPLTELIQRIPLGYSEVSYQGRKYSLSRQDFAKGRSIKVFAKELGGIDFISFNYYLTDSKGIFKPCEMPEQKVTDFLSSFTIVEG